MIRVLVADDHPVVRQGIRGMLEGKDGLAVVGEAGTAAEVRTMLSGRTVDVLVLDLALPGTRDADLLAEVARRPDAPGVVVLTLKPAVAFALRCLKLGALAYLEKTARPSQIVEAIRQAAEGRRYLDGSLQDHLLDRVDRPREARTSIRLSPRELHVTLRLAEGRSVSDIASELGISVKTVSTYRTRTLDKLGLESTGELIRYAVERGLTEAPEPRK